MLSMMLETSEIEKRFRFYEECDEQGNVKGWFYRTREGVFGPFESQAAAEADFTKLLSNQQQENKMIG